MKNVDHKGIKGVKMAPKLNLSYSHLPVGRSGGIKPFSNWVSFSRMYQLKVVFLFETGTENEISTCINIQMYIHVAARLNKKYQEISLI